MEALANSIRLDTAIMALCCLIVAFVMLSFFKVISKVGSNVLKGFFALYGCFLVALAFFLVLPNIHTLLLSTYISMAGACLAIYMYKYIIRYFKKTGVKVLPLVMKDLAIMSFLGQTTNIKRKPKRTELSDKYSATINELVAYEDLKEVRVGHPLYLDKAKKVKAEKQNIDFSGMFFRTISEPNGIINKHWHDCDEYITVLEGDVIVNVYMLDGDFKSSKQYKSGDSFPINEGTIHEVITENGYTINVYFPEKE